MTALVAHSAEEAVLGGILLAGAVPADVLDTGLKSGDFYRSTRAHLFDRILRQHDRGEPIDTVTIPELAPFAGSVPNLGNLGAYAKQVKERALWRTRKNAALEILDSAEEMNEDTYAAAEQRLMTRVEGDRVYDLSRLAALAMDRLDAPVVPGFTMPFLDLRLTPGTVHLWGGWTSHGKTVWVDQMVRDLHRQGAKVWCWLNEMTAEERMCRFVSAQTGLPLQRVLENDLKGNEKAKVVHAMRHIPFGLVECPGWTGQDICRDIRVRAPDVAVIDILHRVPYRDERDLANLSRLLGDTAKLARCVVIATVHLNRGRIVAAARPQPTLADIKGASAFEQDADVVGMVWREDDPASGRPQESGLIYTLKQRMGKPHGVPVVFDGERAMFDLKEAW